MTRDGDDLVFASGRRVYANCGILGVGVSHDGLSVGISGGYDDDLVAEEKYTPEERAELADYAIALWKRWRETGEVRR